MKLYIHSYNILVGKPERKRPLQGLVIDRTVILEWILKEYGGKVWTEFVWLRIRTSDGFLWS
jgi:hypothetical protein